MIVSRRMAGLLVGLAAALGASGCKSMSGPAMNVSGEQAQTPTAQEDQVFLALIRGMNEKGQSQAALAFLDDYLKRHPGNAEALTLQGEALLRTNQLDKAEQVYLALDRRRIQPAAAFGLGQVRAQYNDWKGAAPQYARAAQTAPTDPRVLNNYGFALLKTGDFATAYDVLSRAAQLAGENSQVRTNLAIAALNSGHDDKVTAILSPLPAGERDAALAFARSWKP
ncbi:tetratricopeptide repeat protein [Zavarzinia sp.]|uniref:tetratricopeptide repeat protein n=1 Tax=Zavarzinia sp. TaxID=2027920 RepID=UPI00356693C8